MNKYAFTIIALGISLISTNVSYSEELLESAEQEPTATTTEETLSPEESLPTTPETELDPGLVLPTETPALEEAMISLTPESPVLEKIQPLNLQKDLLTERKVTKKITIDKNASHSCQSDQFSIVLRDGISSNVEIKLVKNLDNILETLEIGSLPKGIDVKINDTYIKSIDPIQNSITITLSKQTDAQKGSFNVPIFYTSKTSEKTSVSICQINIINNG